MSESPDTDHQSMYFARVISQAVANRTTGDVTARTGATWLANNAIDPETNQPAFTVPTAAELLSKPRTGWVSVKTIRSLGYTLFNGDNSVVYIANAVSMGLGAPRTGGGAFGTTQPSWINDLPDPVQTYFRDGFYLFGKAYGLTD